MPVSAELLKALAEDPKSLEHQLGCMAGLFQIFDRQALGRRYGSKRVSNAGSGQSQPTSACETPRHDNQQHHHRNSNNPYWMFEEDSSQRISGESFAVPMNIESGRESHHRPAYSDSSEIFTKSFETPTESRTSPDEKSNLDQSPMYSEESSVMGAWDPPRDPTSCTTSRYASFEHQHGIPGDDRGDLHCNKQLNVVIPARAPPPSDIRDIVRASFERDPQRPSPCHKEKPRLSVDAGSHGQYLKNLPRSASVDGKDRSVPEAPPARHPPADLPRSSSVGGRGPSRMLADWKDGLRSSAGSPRLTGKERDALLHKQKPEGRDVTRLTVELKEGPRLSVSVDDRRASVDASPRPISRFRDVPGELPPNFNRVADIKEFLRGEKKAGREEHRFSVDGTRDAPRACIAPRLSVDGRDNETGTLATRKLKLLDPKDPNYDVNFCRQSSGRKASNVVARLMGLDELVPKETTTTPNKLATRFANLETELYDQAFLHNPEFSPPPPPSPPDDYDYAHHASDHEAFRHGRQPQRFTESSSIHDHFATKHLQELHSQTNTTEGLATQPPCNAKALAIVPSDEEAATQQDEERAHLCKSGDDPKDALQITRKAPQGRRSLWHIFEAMQLKGLLHGSSRRKQAEALRQLNLKEKEGHGVTEQRRSQSLPPRLTTSAVAKELHSGVEFHDHALRAPEVFPRSLLEAHKGSAHELAQANEEAFAVLNPVITRSMSCKAPAASLAPNIQPCGMVPADSDSARKYHPAEDVTPKNLSRAMSKSVGAYHRVAVNEQEPLLQQAAESSSQSSIGRPSRKERIGAAAAAAARPTKSMSELPQREQQQRESSPRCPRGTAAATSNAQENRPSRSCSPSAGSPRCPGSAESGALRVMEAAKVRRKAVAMKDREESKASLAHLRANATKQEFLKERASGDPDTPRLLRRSSSESKLLSKIAEKSATADSVPPAAKARSGTSPRLSLLRSKRPVAKDTSKSPMKSRPTSALGLKGVAKTKERTGAPENLQAPTVSRPATPVSDCVPPAAQAQQPAEGKAGGLQAPSRCEVRATQGGALDQSGETTHANTREHSVRTEPMAREKSIEIDEGVKTPRGVSIKKIDFLEDAQADVAEQPSPVSVLDNSHFDEELTPSPKAGKTSVVSLQEESLRSENDRRWSSARFLDLDLEETSPSSTPPASAQDTPDAAAFLRTPRPLGPPTCLQDAAEESLYVAALLHACSFPRELPSSHYVIDPLTFDQLESQRGDDDDDEASEQEALDRRLLFDCVNEVLERLLGTPPPLGMRALRWSRRCVSVADVLAELSDIPCAAAADVYDTLNVIVQKDLGRERAQQWSDYPAERQEVGGAVERMIVKDLVEETVRELRAGAAKAAKAATAASLLLLAPAESSRRQLFV